MTIFSTTLQSQNFCLLKYTAKKWVELVVSFRRSIKLCLHIVNAFSVVKRRFHNGKTSHLCQRAVPGNKAKVATVLCHTKLMTPVSNRGRLLFNLEYSCSNNIVFRRYVRQYTKIHKMSLFSIRDIHVYFFMRRVC